MPEVFCIEPQFSLRAFSTHLYLLFNFFFFVNAQQVDSPTSYGWPGIKDNCHGPIKPCLSESGL